MSDGSGTHFNHPIPGMGRRIGHKIIPPAFAADLYAIDNMKLRRDA